MPLADVERYIARRFAESERARALALLDCPVIHDGTPASARLVRSAAVASAGSLQKLSYYVEMLKQDWRDVIVAGEYAPGSKPNARVRDLSQPIGDDA